MKKGVFVILIVIDITLCHKQMGHIKINNEKCKNIKCPPDDKPVCVQVTNKSLKNKKPTNIIMVNECEMEYMKCHQGLSAIIVPMKNCDHSDLKKIQTVKKAKKLKSRRLSLRQALNEPYYIKTLESQSDEDDQDHSVTGSDTIESKSSSENSKSSDKSLSGDDKIPLLESPESSDSKKSEIKMESSYKTSYNTEELKDTSVDTSDEGPAVENSQSEHELSSKSHAGSTGESSGSENGIVSKLSSESSHSESGGSDMGLNNIYDKAHMDYEAICPTSCPIRDVMVCARCQHGIYRTFASVCHMRMFSCHHRDEVLELVSRLPCMLSAPYIMNVEHAQHSQRITEPDDDDNVLTYIMCREMGTADAGGSQNLEQNRNYYAKCNFNGEVINTDIESKISEIDSSVQFT